MPETNPVTRSITIEFNEDNSHAFVLNQIITKLSEMKDGVRVFANREEIIETWQEILRADAETPILENCSA